MIQLSLFDWLSRALRRETPESPILSSPYDVWCELRVMWFPERRDLESYTVVWSERAQKRTLASCNVKTKKVLVARELNYPHLHSWLYPLLYHEMCHAVLGMSVFNHRGRSRWHGREFKELEARNPAVAELDAWIANGGWVKAVRSDRTRRAHQQRKKLASV